LRARRFPPAEIEMPSAVEEQPVRLAEAAAEPLGANPQRFFLSPHRQALQLNRLVSSSLVGAMPMSSSGSVTQWIRQLKAGDHEAVQRLWERYFQQLVGLARNRLQGASRRVADEEDVTLSALDSFVRGAARGRFPQLCNRDNLWPLLVKITERKAFRLMRHNGRRKRGGGRVEGESVLGSQGDSSRGKGSLDEFPGNEPTPVFAAQLAENLQRLLAGLPDDGLREIALWKMEGYTNAEIAAKLGCDDSTVERKLHLIRSFWKRGSAS
jgi:DNA-directed RNA polymerase specialized sigma24 family protein